MKFFSVVVLGRVFRRQESHISVCLPCNLLHLILPIYSHFHSQFPLVSSNHAHCVRGSNAHNFNPNTCQNSSQLKQKMFFWFPISQSFLTTCFSQKFDHMIWGSLAIAYALRDWNHGYTVHLLRNMAKERKRKKAHNYKNQTWPLSHIQL